jgi:hypothetical protein
MRGKTRMKNNKQLQLKKRVLFSCAPYVERSYLSDILTP